jgi:hypothetical protein
MRYRALSWLHDDLAAHAGNSATSGGALAQSRRAPLHWQEDAGLATVRDPAALAKLPEAEQVAWRNLWAQIDSLLARIGPGR